MRRTRIGRRVVLTGAGLAMLLGGLLGSRGEPPAPRPQEVLHRAEGLARRQGVRIVLWGLPAGEGSGPGDSMPGIPDGSATAVDPAVLPWALDGIERALDVYPEGFYARQCPTIYVCGSLVLEGRPAGGVHVAGEHWIVLSAPPAHGRETVEATSELGVHHEFSSIVWERVLTLPGRWAKLTPPGQHFEESPGRTLDLADAPALPPETGFLSAYGATSAENDFNTYAETIFTDPSRLSVLATRHRVVAAKLALALDSYIDVDPRMEAVFRRLRLGAWVGASHQPGPGGPDLKGVGSTQGGG
jgi:hypothetical protein